MKKGMIRTQIISMNEKIFLNSLFLTKNSYKNQFKKIKKMFFRFRIFFWILISVFDIVSFVLPNCFRMNKIYEKIDINIYQRDRNAELDGKNEKNPSSFLTSERRVWNNAEEKEEKIRKNEKHNFSSFFDFYLFLLFCFVFDNLFIYFIKP